MNLLQPMKRLAATLRLTRSEAKAGAKAVIAELISGWMRHEPVRIEGLGVFHVRSVEREGEEIRIDLRYVGAAPDALDPGGDPFLSESTWLSARRHMLQLIERRSSPEWWTTIPASATEAWKSRAALAASLIGPGETVLDIGCGGMALERLLPPGCTYIPLDLVARDDRTIVVDLNRDPMPQLSVDTVFILGTIEYLFAPERLLAALSGMARRLVVSHSPYTGGSLEERMAAGWVEHSDRAEFIAMLRRNGWRVAVTHRLDAHQLLHVCKPGPTEPEE